MKNEMNDLVYMHLQASERFVVSNGVSFCEFVSSLPDPLPYTLLLKHQLEETEFNLNVLMDFVPPEYIQDFIRKEWKPAGDFCWVDFEDPACLDELEGQEIAELLYMGHTKNHLNSPFFRKLNNRFAYLSIEDSLLSKVYYRSLDEYFCQLGKLISLKAEAQESGRSWIFRKRNCELLPVPQEAVRLIAPLLSEGVVFSMRQMRKSRIKIEIPLYLVGDFMNFDEMMEEYQQASIREPDVWLIFQKKSKDWTVAKNKSRNEVPL
ncbi:hypothetical protein [Bacillus massiliglaciei]|uniref:hypothetical protein n=1 Tax=Bacillus massiliglaciei TaxID=1816693 RepID=UPI000DA60852|nr:hypothetical protein [Bacillus massiliglaciei]